MTSPKLEVSSTAFKHNGSIPSDYTCEGKNINPALEIKNIPTAAKSLAVIMDDPDAPNGTFVHWVTWNLPVKEIIPENSSPGTEGNNGRGNKGYMGPCPPSGTHHYHFKVYALDTSLDLKAGATKAELESAMKSHILAQGETVGVYKKTKP